MERGSPTFPWSSETGAWRELDKVWALRLTRAGLRERFLCHMLGNQKQRKGDRSPAERMLSEGCDSRATDALSLVPAHTARGSSPASLELGLKDLLGPAQGAGWLANLWEGQGRASRWSTLTLQVSRAGEARGDSSLNWFKRWLLAGCSLHLFAWSVSPLSLSKMIALIVHPHFLPPEAHPTYIYILLTCLQFL